MWMMGCNDGGEICLPTNNDSFSSCRKLRPLIPRPPPNPSSNSPNHHHQHHSRGHQHHGRGSGDPNHHGLFPLNHHNHLATMVEQSKREFNAAHHVVVSSRWNPTPEQLRALEEMYRRGTRTPSADQIQQITSQLRRYGKIEGKNVFYWFQNHKARERQKRRRQMESCSRAEEEKGHLNNHRETGNLRCKESGDSCKTAADDVQRANNNNNHITAIDNNYNWEAAEGSNIDKGGKSAMAGGGGGGGGGSASASSSATAVKETSTSSASSTAVVTSLWMKLNDTRELLLPNSSLIITGNSMTNYDNLRRNATCPHPLPPPPFVLPTSTTAGHTILTPLRSSSPPPLPSPSQDFQTLQLFPLQSEEYEEDRVCFVGEEDHLRRHFFEFLPMKN